MNSRKIACFAAALFLGLGLTATTAAAQPSTTKEVVVEGKRFDPTYQRLVPYGDLNLAFSSDQRVLLRRLARAARGLCIDFGYHRPDEAWICTGNALDSTDDQVAAAIARAKAQLAGKSVGPAVAISMVVGGR